MSEVDRELFREKYEDLKYMESKYVRLQTLLLLIKKAVIASII